MPHAEKASFLLFGWDCKLPTEAAFIPPECVTPTTVTDYREELMAHPRSASANLTLNLQVIYSEYVVA